MYPISESSHKNMGNQNFPSINKVQGKPSGGCAGTVNRRAVWRSSKRNPSVVPARLHNCMYAGLTWVEIRRETDCANAKVRDGESDFSSCLDLLE